MAPLQKAGIVSLVKNRSSDLTLAVGDGVFSSVALFQIANFCKKKVHKLKKKKQREKFSIDDKIVFPSLIGFSPDVIAMLCM